MRLKINISIGQDNYQLLEEDPAQEGGTKLAKMSLGSAPTGGGRTTS